MSIKNKVNPLGLDSCGFMLTDVETSLKFACLCSQQQNAKYFLQHNVSPSVQCIRLKQWLIFVQEAPKVWLDSSILQVCLYVTTRPKS